MNSPLSQISLNTPYLLTPKLEQLWGGGGAEQGEARCIMGSLKVANSRICLTTEYLMS